MSQLTDIFSLYPSLLIGYLFIIGLVVGSFLNVVIYRLPVMMERNWRQECQELMGSDQPNAHDSSKLSPFNLATPRSTCPHCQSQIRWYDNIPIVSWCLLKGKCRDCSNAISMRYPLIELLTGLLSGFVGWKMGFDISTLFALLFCWFLIALTFIDLDTFLLPDQLTLPLLWLGLLISLTGTFTSPESSILGAAIGYLFLFSLYWGFKLLTGKEGMGFGDFKLLAALGAWLGWESLLLVILLSSTVGAFVGLAMIAIKGHDKQQPIPFGPYLATAGLISFFYQDQIISFYWNLLL